MTRRLLTLTIALASLCPVGAQTVADGTRGTADRARLLQDKIRSSQTNLISDDLNALLDLYRQQYTAESAQYADALQWAAMACAEAGDNRQGQRLLGQSDQLFARYGHGTFRGRDTVQQIFRHDLRSRLLYNSGADYRALRQAKHSLELKRQHFGPHSEPYLNQLLDVSRLYAERMQYRKSNCYHNEGYNSYVELIKHEFCTTSESERSMYWDKAVKYINKTIELAHRAASKTHIGSEPQLCQAAYNALLLSKGLLLNTTIDFENYVSASGNQRAMAALREKKAATARGEQQHVLDSLDYVMLGALHDARQDYHIPQLSITWRDVADRLLPGDLAIEFYKTTHGDYGALVLRHDWKAPKIVRLKHFARTGSGYEELAAALAANPMEHYTARDARRLWALSRAVWTDDLLRYFPEQGDGRIFFSADGILLVSGIEYLPFVCPDDGTAGDDNYASLSDLFPVYRLSSTRELVTHSAGSIGRDATIYGGLAYSMSAAAMQQDAQRLQGETTRGIALASDSRGERGAKQLIPFLEGTLAEADSITATINTARISGLSATAYTQQQGTEASFKALSGKQRRVIHVATHGFFRESNTADATTPENPLLRSGLYFAGADNREVPDGVDDGTLTALEIAGMDLRGLDLVALSACETAKGDVRGDGVFGLQRGFKMASAGAILMSLWQVDDEATRVLMTEFYRQWTAGKSKHEALQMARDVVRQKSKRWQSPRYWAAFVLLDGLD